jgi:hypothetical protein
MSLVVSVAASASSTAAGGVHQCGTLYSQVNRNIWAKSGHLLLSFDY